MKICTNTNTNTNTNTKTKTKKSTNTNTNSKKNTNTKISYLDRVCKNIEGAGELVEMPARQQRVKQLSLQVMIPPKVKYTFR